jgi:hypothetical protein
MEITEIFALAFYQILPIHNSATTKKTTNDLRTKKATFDIMRLDLKALACRVISLFEGVVILKVICFVCKH